MSENFLSKISICSLFFSSELFPFVVFLEIRGLAGGAWFEAAFRNSFLVLCLSPSHKRSVSKTEMETCADSVSERSPAM